jgi:hypothetical protein
MISNGARELYLAKSPMKNCFLQRRNARHTCVDHPEATKTSGHQKSMTGLLQKYRRILPIKVCVGLERGLNVYL